MLTKLVPQTVSKNVSAGNARVSFLGGPGARRRNKVAWAGLRPEDAFKPDLPREIRECAWKLFMETFRKAFEAVGKRIGGEEEAGWEEPSTPNFRPLETSYPSALAVSATIGLNAFIRARKECSRAPFDEAFKSYLANSAIEDGVEASPAVYRKVVKAVCGAVQTRLLMEEVAASGGSEIIRAYRLFSASQESMDLESLPRILDWAIVYSDVCPSPEWFSGHFLSLKILREVSERSKPFLSEPLGPEGFPNEKALEWIKEVSRGISRFLPRVGEKDRGSSTTERPEPAFSGSQAFQPFGMGAPPTLGRLGGLGDFLGNRYLNTLEASLLGSARRIGIRSREPSPSGRKRDSGVPDTSPSVGDRVGDVIENLAEAVDKTLGKPVSSLESDWDRLKKQLEEEESVLKLEPVPEQPQPPSFVESLTEIATKLWNGLSSSSQVDWGRLAREILETLIVGSPVYSLVSGFVLAHPPTTILEEFPSLEDIRKPGPASRGETLRRLVEPVARRLKRILFPEEDPGQRSMEFSTTGRLDSRRLPLFQTSGAVFRKPVRPVRKDPTAPPFLWVAGDSSGSMTGYSMEVMTFFFGICLLAFPRNGLAECLYSSKMVPIRSVKVRKPPFMSEVEFQLMVKLFENRIHVPLVEWVCNHRKNPAAGETEMMARAASIGLERGWNIDVPSLELGFQEALKSAGSRKIRLVLLSDCNFNASSQTGKSGVQEVSEWLRSISGRHPGRLRTTLVGLDSSECPKELRGAVQEFIPVLAEESTDPASGKGIVGRGAEGGSSARSPQKTAEEIAELCFRHMARTGR